MKSFLRLFIFIIIYLFCVNSVQAAHILGGGFQYKYIGQNQFKLILKIYRDPNSGGANFENVLAIKMRKLSNNLVVSTILLPRVKVEKTSSGVFCQGTLDNIEIGYFEDTVTLDSSMNDTSGYYFTWERCCRQTEIVNILDPGSVPTTFFISLPKLYRNSMYLDNNTPSLNFDLKTNIMINDTIDLSFKYEEPDQDNILLSLNTPIAGAETSFVNPSPSSPSFPIEYSIWQVDHSVFNPILNDFFYFDNNIGLIKIDAKNAGLNALAFEIKEYRNGILISTSNMEYTLLFKNIPNYFTVQPKNISSITNNKVSVIAKHTVNAARYQWQVKSDISGTFVNIQNANNDTLEFEFNSADLNNLYRCIVNSNSMNCADTSIIVGFSITSSTSNLFTQNLHLYPNPTSSTISINTDLIINKIEVYDLTGRKHDVIWKSNFLDVSSLADGIYIIKVNDLNKRSYFGRFIKKI